MIPIYCDGRRKIRHTRDENSTVMLDLICGNHFYDLGDTLFCGDIRDGVFAGKFRNNARNPRSALKSLTKIAERTINRCVSAFDALEKQP